MLCAFVAKAPIILALVYFSYGTGLREMNFGTYCTDYSQLKAPQNTRQCACTPRRSVLLLLTSSQLWLTSHQHSFGASFFVTQDPSR